MSLDKFRMSSLGDKHREQELKPSEPVKEEKVEQIKKKGRRLNK